ncbi:hypothetical protein D1BOALGB6SA_3408 [Olavius sp. associated proteobacterium Delta 1]|nr:hypothetical protein D1BOALGB6SA_3408 [Olavius sp. associated proteobacterium Delta 1]
MTILVPQFKIPNFKHQIPIKSQNPISNYRSLFRILNFDHWNLFDFCDL